MNQRSLVAICTDRPSHAVTTTSGGGGCLALVCPRTGTFLSSLRIHGELSGKGDIGISSLSVFPQHQMSSGNGGGCLALAVGSTVDKKEDSYAMLLHMRRSSQSLPPIVHWKCRLPEPNLTAGLLVSPCGQYIVGGGSTGTLYFYQAIGGVLLATVKAHYRAVSVLAWSSCQRCLVTGGDDGMIHVYLLSHLVQQPLYPSQQSSQNNTNKSIRPLCSWSKHQLPVTSLITLPSGRMVSGGQDGQVLVLELFSHRIVAQLQVPSPVTCLAATGAVDAVNRTCRTSGQQLMVGCQSGIIHIIDLDQYAVHLNMAQTGIMTAGSNNNNNKHQSSKEGTKSASYLAELRGHDRAVTALAIVPNGAATLEHLTADVTTTSSSNNMDADSSLLLVSGDRSGMVRIWDIPSRLCLRVVTPWSTTTTTSSTGPTATAPSGTTEPSGATSCAQHAVTSIVVLPEPVDDHAVDASLFAGAAEGSATSSFGVGRSQKKQHNHSVSSLSKLITPLQKFASDQPLSRAVTIMGLRTTRKRLPGSNHHQDGTLLDGNDSSAWQQQQQRQRLDLVQVVLDHCHKKSKNRPNTTTKETSNNNNKHSDTDTTHELQRARAELEQAKATIARWEAVNNRLLERLQQQEAIRR